MNKNLEKKDQTCYAKVQNLYFNQCKFAFWKFLCSKINIERKEKVVKEIPLFKTFINTEHSLFLIKFVSRVLDCIECGGPRVFLREGVPCVKHTAHYFVTTLLYSILLGFLGNIQGSGVYKFSRIFLWGGVERGRGE